MNKVITRTCIVTRKALSRGEMFRVVKTPNHEIKIDSTYKAFLVTMQVLVITLFIIYRHRRSIRHNHRNQYRRLRLHLHIDLLLRFDEVLLRYK